MAAARTPEQKLVDMFIDVLNRRHVQTEIISSGLERIPDFQAQRILLDIILELLNAWRMNHDPVLYEHYPNHPLRSVYETAARMLAALGPEVPYEPDMADTGPIPVIPQVEGMVERLPKKSRRTR